MTKTMTILKRILVSSSFSLTLLLATQHGVAQTVTGNTQGTNNGFFYSFWNDGSSGSASMTLGTAGSYTTTWSNIGNFTAGKGWATGSPTRVVCYSGSFNGGSNGFLAVYGWTKSPLIEYYVCENHGSWTPPGNTGGIVNKGTFTSDGGTYTIYSATRTNAPNITGTNQNFQQYWSVRTQTRSSGTVTFANHVAAWKAAGMNMGTTWDYQIMETEGYQSSGSSNITVSECTSNTCATTAPTVTATVTYGVGDIAKPLTATGTALKWYTVATGGTASTTAPTPNTSTAGTTTYYVSQTANGCEGPTASIVVNVVNYLNIPKACSAPTIDGQLSDDAWTTSSTSKQSLAKVIVGTVANTADLSGYFQSTWDATNLYVMGNITDNIQVNGNCAALYNDDAIELFLDLGNTKATAYAANDFQFTFRWSNPSTMTGNIVAGSNNATTSVSGINFAFAGGSATGTGYTFEASIPWSLLGGSPAIGQLVGFDLHVDDDDAGSCTRKSKMSWNATADQAYTDPSYFGTAKLAACPTVTGIQGTEDDQASRVVCYPNPFSGQLSLQCAGTFSYSICDMVGNELDKGTATDVAKAGGNLGAGIYLVKITQNGSSKIIKVCKE